MTSLDRNMNEFIRSATWSFYKYGKWTKFPTRVVKKIEKAYLMYSLGLATDTITVEHNGIDYAVSFTLHKGIINNHRTYVGRTILKSKSLD